MTPADEPTQRKIGAVLRNAELRPTRLGASAILCLLRLRDPAPGARWAGYGHTYPPPLWQSAVTLELDRLAGQAARPALGTVSSAAEAVLFSDRAEMLACLALDWQSGTVRSNWWWATLLRRDDPAAVLAREWTTSPQFVPAAVEHLARRGRVVAFARKISDPLADALLSGVLDAFGISPGGQSGGATPVQEASGSRMPAGQGGIESSGPAAMAWRSLAPEADAPGLSPVKRVLIAQALVLRRAPAVARSYEFQRVMAEWRSEQDSARPSGSVVEAQGSSQADIPDVVRGKGGERGPANGHDASQEDQREDGRPIERRADGKQEPGLLRVDAPRDLWKRVKTRVRSRVIEGGALGAAHNDRLETEYQWLPESPPHEELDAIDESAESAGAESGALEELDNPVASQAVSDVLRVESSFAGVFFLINVALALGLYSDFTNPSGENLQLGVWDFLYLLGEQFAGGELQDDALAEVLAELAGRSAEQRPGAGFEPPHEWRVPDEWLEAFPEPFERKEEIRDGRVQVAHPAGFLIEDHALSVDADGGLERWVGWMAAYVRARLQRAVGLNDAAEFLCRVHGSIEVTAMNVDVHYSLQTHPIEIRLAGLDRDPGWVPAAGRYVAYHFD
jgi:hypothetical protein